MLRVVLASTTFLAAVTLSAAENTYLLGAGVSADNADGRSISGLIDYGFTEATSMSLIIAFTEASGEPEDVRTRGWNLGLNHDFGPIGVDLSLGQWGDPDHFDSDDVSAGVFVSSERWYAAANYLSRDIDLTFRANILDRVFERTLSTKADGVSAVLRYTNELGASFFVSGATYDYDADVTRLDQFEILRLLTPTTITLSGSLLDSTFSVGAEMPLGERSLSASYTRDATATDQIDVDTLAIGLLNPMGSRTDLDVSVGYSDAQNADSGVFVSLLVFYYGG